MLELDRKNYVREVEEASLPVLIGLYSKEQPLSAGFEQLAKDQGHRLKFCKVDTGKQRDLAQRLCTQADPSILLLHGGKVDQRLRGSYDKAALMKILDLN